MFFRYKINGRFPFYKVEKHVFCLQELYDKAGIGVPQEDQEVNDVVIFGVMVAEFLADFRQSHNNTS